MKKLFTILLATMMLFSLAACDEKEPAADATVMENIEVNINSNKENIELETTITEQTIIDALTDLGYGSAIISQTVNQNGMVSWSGTIINAANAENIEHTVDLYAIIFNYTGSPEAAEAKLSDMREISSDFEIFMADIEDEMVVVIGGNGEYYDDAMTLIDTIGYTTK